MDRIIEPFKIKMVEPIKLTTREQREAILRSAHFSVFQIAAGDVIIDLLTEPRNRYPFKGNINVDKLRRLIDDVGPERIHLCVITVTNNSGGGQPVSLANLHETHDICQRHGIKLFLDAARFAENAWLIHEREPEQKHRPVREIVREIFDLVDGAMISAKKDGLVNIGGVLLTRDDSLAGRADNLLMLTEGFITYGGLAGRDLEAMAQGFQDVFDEDYLRYRIASVAYLGERLLDAGIQIIEPPGGHAIYIDACTFCPHLSAEQFPGQALVCGFYRHAGIRAVEIGSVMFGEDKQTGPGKQPAMELTRLAIPRRVYTKSQIDYVAEAVIEVHEQRDALRGLRITEAPATLRHFTARFEEI